MKNSEGSPEITGNMPVEHKICVYFHTIFLSEWLTFSCSVLVNLNSFLKALSSCEHFMYPK